MTTSPSIAVVALQGDFEMHLRAFRQLGASPYAARLPEEIEAADAIVIPGGESTTIGKLMRRYGLDQAIIRTAKMGKPIYGTCAGLILMAKRILADTDERGGQPTLGLLEATVARNAFGRQRESFEAKISAPAVSDAPIGGVFIRAPYMVEVASPAEALGSLEGKIVLARQGNLLGSAFHSELSEDLAVHRYFLGMVAEANQA